VTFTGTTADISFTAVDAARYRVTVLDDDGVTLTLSAGVTGTLAGASGANIVVGNFGNQNTNGTGSVALDFTATVGEQDDKTAKIRLNGVQAGYKVTIRRVNDFGDILAGSAAQTITLKDDFEPHVAVQNSNRNGQDTDIDGALAATLDPGTAANGPLGALGAAGLDSGDTSEMIFQCGVETSDDNGENEVGDAAYFFPKLNLSASLYDKSNLRAHTEILNPGSLISTALNQGQTTFVSAEDSAGAAGTTSTIATNALNTPLLATTAATDLAVGTTETGRSDEYYTASDYDAWGLLTTTTGGPTCVYYVAEGTNVDNGFTGDWYLSDAAGTVAVGAAAHIDDDGDQDTIPTDFPEGTGFVVSGTYTLPLLNGSTFTGNIVVGPSGCGAPGTSVYNFARNAILNMTEAVAAPADMTAFAAEPGVCGQNNIPTGELSAATGLTAISGPGDGFNDDHLVLSFGDWRTIDDSNHFTSNAEAAIANQLSEGSSLTDLLQIVSITDANGISATAGNGRGVLIVDATPPLATYMENNGSSVVIGFDQTVSTGDNGEDTNDVLDGVNSIDSEFEIQGDGVIYTFNFTDDAVGDEAWTVVRSTDYVDRFGARVAAGTRLDITLTADENPGYDVDGDGTLEVNVPAGTSNSRFTISMADPSTTSGDNANGDVDYSDFFNEMSHTTAASASAATTVADPTFHLEYRDLEDNNFNSWANVETYDAYDGNDGVPHLVGIDKQGPQLSTAISATIDNNDVDEAYLVASSGSLTLSSVHATDDQDGDITYTPSANGAITGVTTDTELAYIYGYASGTQTVNTPNGNQRLVIKLSENVNAAAIADAIAYVYRPNVETDDATVADGLGENGDSIFPSGDLDDTVAGVGGEPQADSYSGGQATASAGSVGELDNALIVELPDLSAEAVAQGDLIVIQNLLFDGHYYSIHIEVPVAINEDNVANPGREPAASEAAIAPLTHTIYRQVYLDANRAAVGNGNASGFQTGTAITTANANQASAITLAFREDVANVTAVGWTAGQEDEDNDVTDDDTANFFASVADTTPNANNVVVNLNALSSAQSTNPITETDGDDVGHDSILALTVEDASGISSDLSITLRKGHGADITAQTSTNASGLVYDEAILNVLSGTAIND